MRQKVSNDGKRSEVLIRKREQERYRKQCRAQEDRFY